MRFHLALVALALLHILGCSGGGGNAVSPPSVWPIEALTLPPGVKDATFMPTTGEAVRDEIGERTGRVRTRHVDPPRTYTAMFAFDGEPEKVFDHVRSVLVPAGFMEKQSQLLAEGTEAETITAEFSDGKFLVILTFWRMSDKPGSKPFHLVVRQAE